MGKQINQLTEASTMGLDDFFGVDLDFGSAYGARKVKRRTVLRQAELPERTAPAMEDTLLLEGIIDGIPTPYKLPLGKLPINIMGKTHWVDGANGNDSLGRPFKTITAAKAAAASGEIIIVGPSVYNENDLLKNGINYLFFPGAVVRYQGSSGYIFDDKGQTVSCRIMGWGIFDYQGTDLSNASGVLRLANTYSSVNFEYDQMISVGNTIYLLNAASLQRRYNENVTVSDGSIDYYYDRNLQVGMAGNYCLAISSEKEFRLDFDSCIWKFRQNGTFFDQGVLVNGGDEIVLTNNGEVPKALASAGAVGKLNGDVTAANMSAKIDAILDALHAKLGLPGAIPPFE